MPTNQGTITPEFAAQIENLRMQYMMMGQEPPYPEAQAGGNAVEYLTNIALGVDQRQARDWAESLGINPDAFNQHVEQVELSTRDTPNAVFGAIDNVGQTFAENPWLYFAAPFAAAGLTGAFGAGAAGAGGAAGSGGGVAGSGVLAGGQNAALGLTGLESAGAIGAGLAPGAGVLLPGASAGLAAGGGIAGSGVLAGGQNAALGLTGLEGAGAAGALAPGAGVLLPGSAGAAGAGAVGNALGATGGGSGNVSVPGAGGAAQLPPGGGVLAPGAQQAAQSGMGLEGWLTLGGALAGMLGSGDGDQTTTAESGPPAYLQPYLNQALGQAQSLYNQNPAALVTPFSQQTQDALSLTEQRARSGSPVTQAAQNYVTNGLSSPLSSQFGSATNPYASSAYSSAGANPYANNAYTSAGGNPYANSPNPFGGASNPYLDAQFEMAANRTQNRLTSEYARAGRDVDASAPARAGMLSDLAAQIYAPAYENERNRQLQYQSQLTGIGAQGFENEQSRTLQGALAGQGIGAQSFENDATRRAQAALAAQGIGAQGFENERSRMLSDLTAQRANQLGMLGYSGSLASQDYLDYGQLANVGAQHEALAREQAGAPGLALDQYLARIQGMPGSSVTQTTPTDRNWLAGAAGGALLGSQIGQAWGQPGSPYDNPYAAYGYGGYGGYRP